MIIYDFPEAKKNISAFFFLDDTYMNEQKIVCKRINSKIKQGMSEKDILTDPKLFKQLPNRIKKVRAIINSSSGIKLK